MSVFRKAAVLGTVALIAAAAGANAVPFTYTYTGAEFLDNNTSGTHTAGGRITGQFTIDVASNLNLAVADRSGSVTSASFNDTVRSLTAPVPDPVITFIFGTDANGDIVLPDAINFSGFPAFPNSSSIFQTIPGLLIEGPTGFINDFIRVTSAGDLSQGPDDEQQAFTVEEGTFTLVVDKVAEPNTLALLGIGLVGFGFLSRRKRAGSFSSPLFRGLASRRKNNCCTAQNNR